MNNYQSIKENDTRIIYFHISDIEINYLYKFDSSLIIQYIQALDDIPGIKSSDEIIQSLYDNFNGPILLYRDKKDTQFGMHHHLLFSQKNSGLDLIKLVNKFRKLKSFV